MDGNTNEENSPLEAKPPMKRMSSFEIDKPLISSNESDGEKKEISVVNVMAPQTQEYDSRYLSLKQVSTPLSLQSVVLHHTHEEHYGTGRPVHSVLHAADGHSRHFLLLHRSGGDQCVVFASAC